MFYCQLEKKPPTFSTLRGNSCLSSQVGFGFPGGESISDILNFHFTLSFTSIWLISNIIPGIGIFWLWKISFFHGNFQRFFFFFLSSSIQFSRSVMSDSLQPHESQHTRPPCPTTTPGVHSDSRPSSQWCHPAISSSVVPLSFCPQSLPASGSFPMSQLFTWGGQSTGVSASASFLPKISQG